MLLERSPVSTTAAIEALAGLQGQEPAPVFTGLWTRLEGFDAAELRELVLKREVVRGTAMRGTIHLLTARDFPRIRAAVQASLDRTAAATGKRAEEIDLDLLAKKARSLLRAEPRTMKELVPILAPDFPEADPAEIRHALRVRLPMVLVPDEGDPRVWKGNAPFADAADWLERKGGRPLPRTELVRRYLAAFGPACPADFGVWSGLADVRKTFERLRPELEVFEDESGRELFDLAEAPRPDGRVAAPVRFVPAFDNLTLSHRFRDRIIAAEDLKLVFSPNGRIPPMFLLDGFVAGTWKNVSERTQAKLELRPFRALTIQAKTELRTEGERLLEFLEPGAKNAKVRIGAKLSRR